MGYILKKNILVEISVLINKDAAIFKIEKNFATHLQN